MLMYRLYVGNKNTGVEVRPDAKWPTMWRIHAKGQVSDMVNLTRAKDAAISWWRPKGLSKEEVASWHCRETSSPRPSIHLNDEG